MNPEPFPTHIQIQTTVACGAACSICPHPTQSPSWINGAMSDALFDRICDQLTDRGVRYISPYLMADPLSDRHIFDRVAQLRSAVPDAHIEISTTGMYLVPRVTERLLQTPLTELRISSHGTTAAEYARTMPGVNHDKAMPQIESFIEKWQKTQPFELSIVSLWGMWPQAREVEIEEHWQAHGVALSKWRLISRSRHVDLTVFADGSPDPRPYATQEQHAPFVCREGRDHHWLHVLSDGRVTLCCMDYGQEVIIGDLTRQTIDEIWQGPALAAARGELRGDTPCRSGFLCERCEWRVNEAVHLQYEVRKAATASS